LKETGILFTGLMMNAIRKNTKSETRRVRGLAEINANPDDWELDHFDEDFGWCFWQKSESNPEKGEKSGVSIKCPYGVKDDRLWCRENFKKVAEFEYSYQADYDSDQIKARKPWKPSIHMPRVACRENLVVLETYPQRIHSMTEGQAMNEGIMSLSHDWVMSNMPDYAAEYRECMRLREQGIVRKPPLGPLPTVRFKMLWEEINGKDSYDSNPWVWVVRFRRFA